MNTLDPSIFNEANSAQKRKALSQLLLSGKVRV